MLNLHFFKIKMLTQGAINFKDPKSRPFIKTQYQK